MSGSHAAIRGIIERSQRNAAGDALLGNHQLIVSGADIILGQTIGFANVAIADRLADRVTEAPAREVADLHAVAKNGLAAEEDDRGIIADETGEAFVQQGVGLL